MQSGKIPPREKRIRWLHTLNKQLEVAGWLQSWCSGAETSPAPGPGCTLGTWTPPGSCNSHWEAAQDTTAKQTKIQEIWWVQHTLERTHQNILKLGHKREAEPAVSSISGFNNARFPQNSGGTAGAAGGVWVWDKGHWRNRFVPNKAQHYPAFLCTNLGRKQQTPGAFWLKLLCNLQI